jgi:hypothetical protein
MVERRILHAASSPVDDAFAARVDSAARRRLAELLPQ